MSALVVAHGRVVLFELRLTDERGEIVDETDGAAAYLHGADNILDGLERVLEGRSAGDVLEGILPPSEAFGDASEEPPHAVSRFAFPKDAPLEPGMHFLVDEDGEERDFWVTEVKAETVFARPEHPLAGRTMRYWVRVVDVRPATPAELEHGHPI